MLKPQGLTTRHAHSNTTVIIKTAPCVVRELSEGNGCKRHEAEKEHSSDWRLGGDTAFGLGHKIFSRGNFGVKTESFHG